MELKVVHGPRALGAIPGDVHETIWRAAGRQEVPSLGGRMAKALRAAVDAVIDERRAAAEATRAALDAPHALLADRRDDVLERVVDAWAVAEATASLTAQAAEVHDELDRLRNENVVPPGVGRRGVLEALTGVLEAGCRLWVAGRAADVLRSTMGLLQAEARTRVMSSIPQFDLLLIGEPSTDVRAMSVAMTGEVFLTQLRAWVDELRQAASTRPGTGACTIASGIELWRFTLGRLRRETPRPGAPPAPIFDGMGVKAAMADALSSLLAVRAEILDLEAFARLQPADAGISATWDDRLAVLADVCHDHAARAAGETGRICAELVYGYRPHPAWDAEGVAGCFQSDDLEVLEECMPGLVSCARAYGDVVDAAGTHRPKAGPCARFEGVETFVRLRTRLDGCLSGARLAHDRAVASVAALAALD